MADFSFQMPDEFMEQLKQCANIDEIAPKMINEALPIVDRAFKRNLAAHRDTGELIDSLKVLPAMRFKNGAWGGMITAIGTAKGKVYKRKKALGATKTEGYRNNQKLLALEYGTSKQKPTPVLDKTINDAESEVIDKMQDVFEREMQL
jgi:hypothetical protein